MSEHYEHNPSDHEDPVTGPSWLLGVVGAVLLVVIIFGLTGLYYTSLAREQQQKIIAREYPTLRQYRQEQSQRLTGEERWETREIFGEEVRVRVIPIEQAMEDVIREYGQ